MPEQKLITVIGATGAQGGGLARAILADPNGPFRLARSRGIPPRTRPRRSPQRGRR